MDEEARVGSMSFVMSYSEGEDDEDGVIVLNTEGEKVTR